MSALLHLVEAATALTQLVGPSMPMHQQQAASSSASGSPLPYGTAGPFSSSLSFPRKFSTHTIRDDDDTSANNAAYTKMATLRENHLQALRVAASNTGLSAALPAAPTTSYQQPAATPVAYQEHIATPATTGWTHYPQQVTTATNVSPRGGCGAAAADAAKEMFPMRLHALLSDPTVHDVISWLPHGKSFVVLRPDVFAMRVLPRYFAPEGSNSLNAKTTTVVGKDGSFLVKNKSPGVHKYPSFTRKLNRWGFRQISRGPDAGAFCHEMFQREDPALCRGMVCQKSRKLKKMPMSAAGGGMMDDMISISSASTMGTKQSVVSGEKRPFSSTVTVSTAGVTSNKSLPFKKRKSGQMNNFMMNDIPCMISHRNQKMPTSTSSVTESDLTSDNQKMPASTSSVTESDLTSENSSVCSSNVVHKATVQAVHNAAATAEVTAMEALQRHFHEQQRALALASLMENSRMAMQAAGMNNQACVPTAAATGSASVQGSSVDNSRREYFPVLGAMTTHSQGVFAPTVSIPEEKKMPSAAAPISSAEAAKSALYKAYLQALSSSAPSS